MPRPRPFVEDENDDEDVFQKSFMPRPSLLQTLVVLSLLVV